MNCLKHTKTTPRVFLLKSPGSPKGSSDFANFFKNESSFFIDKYQPDKELNKRLSDSDDSSCPRGIRQSPGS